MMKHPHPRNAHFPHRPSRRVRGVALIELAFVLPLLVVLTFAVLEFSMALAQYKTVVNQVRAAARYLTTEPPGTGHAVGSTVASTEVSCMVKYGVPSSPCTATVPMAHGFTGATVVVTVEDAMNATSTHRSQATAPGVANSVVVNLVTVRVSGYRYSLSFRHLLPGIFGTAATINFEPISATMRQVN